MKKKPGLNLMKFFYENYRIKQWREQHRYYNWYDFIMNHKKKIKLKPCPFCGSKAEIFQRGNYKQPMIIGCTHITCGAQITNGDVVGLTDPKNYRWNQRSSK